MCAVSLRKTPGSGFLAFDAVNPKRREVIADMTRTALAAMTMFLVATSGPEGGGRV